MPAPALLSLAKKACIANIRHIDDVGEMPYALARSILLKIESPDQLRTIEKNSPQILGSDAELWKNFIKRDIPGWQSKQQEPKNPHNWFKVYRKLRREAEEEVKNDEAALKAALDERKSEAASHRITMVNKVMVPVPKKQRPVARPTSRADTSVLSFRAGSRTKTTTGKGLINKVRREARDASLLSAGRGALATPTHLLAARANSTQPIHAVKHSLTPSASSVGARTTQPVPERQKIVGQKRLPPSVFMNPKKRARHF